MLLRKLGKENPIDFILYIGEETINEQAFSFLNVMDKDSGSMQHYIKPECPIFTCTVGQKFTKAKYYLDQNKDEISSTLKQLILKPKINRPLDNTRKIQSMAAMPHRNSLGLNKLNLLTEKVKVNVNPVAAEGSPILRKTPPPGYQDSGLPYNVGSPEIERKPIQYTG